MSRLYQIQNEYLTVQVSSRGGSLYSVKDTEGSEYLWQGDAAYWGDRAPNLFPYVARLTDGKYTFQGKEYSMKIHGFLKESELLAAEERPDFLELIMESSETTRVQYPFSFLFSICYELQGDTLQVTFRVKNQDEKTMYFGLGGHPGFCVPLEKGLDFTDYELVFTEKKPAVRVGFSDDCYVMEENNAPFPLAEGRKLALRHELFDQDAIVLRDMGRQVTLCSPKGKKSVCVTYPQMPYLGIWHMPHTDAPYVCIEPWVSLPSRKGIVEDLETKEDLVRLESGKVYENVWSIRIVS